VADVNEALLTHRPRRGVQVVAAVGEPDRVVDQLVVAVADHPDRVALFQRDVRAVHRVQAGPAGADRPVPPQLALVVDVQVVRLGAGHHDQRRPDVERLGQVGGEVDARRGLQPGQVPVERDRGVGRPVVHRPEVQRLVAVPVPRPGHRLGAGHLQRPLHRGAVADRRAERQPDRHAHAVALLVPLEDHRGVGRGRGQRAEAAHRRDRLAGGVHRGGVHGVAPRRLQRPVAPPHRLRAVQRAAHRVMPGGHRDALDLPLGGLDHDAVGWVGPPRPVGRGNGQRGAGRRDGVRGPLAGRLPGGSGRGRCAARAGGDDQARHGRHGGEHGHPASACHDALAA
jgi:hypothetical protein